MSKCAHCQHLSLTSEKHLAAGWGGCNQIAPERIDGQRMTVWVGVTRDRECDKFEQASDAVIEKRRQERVKRNHPALNG